MNVAVAGAELYHPVTMLFTATGAMRTPGAGDTATLLSSGLRNARPAALGVSDGVRSPYSFWQCARAHPTSRTLLWLRG